MQQTIAIFAGCGSDRLDQRAWDAAIRLNGKFDRCSSVPLRHMGPLTATVLVQFLRDLAAQIDSDQEHPLVEHDRDVLFGGEAPETRPQEK